MQKLVLKGLTMIMLIAAVALMAALVSAHAQSSRVVADVPFDFIVGNTSLKAGEYSVRSFTASGDTLLIRSRNSDSSAVRLTQTIQVGDPQNGKLVFHRYGERYFLAEVWTEGERIGRQLMKSGEERAIENQLASISSKGKLARANYERVEIIAMVR